MNKFSTILKSLTAIIIMLAAASLAQAQATRTWVSGVGDDVNPCSRTAPCKTFAGAISKTAAGGEINALDPGGYGTITITKSITINGTGTEASILAAGASSGVTVNATATDFVYLRNLDINGAGTGVNGVRFLAGKQLHIENCNIWGFTTTGVDVVNSATGSQVYIKDTNIKQITGASASGIKLSTTAASGIVIGVMDRVRLEGMAIGLNASNGTRASIRDSVVAGTSTNGLNVTSAAGFTSELTVDNCLIAHNTNIGINAGSGGTVRLGRSTIVGSPTGINFAGGAVRSFGNNQIDGNTNNFIGGAMTGVPQQ